MTIAIISSLFFFAVAAILRTDQLKEMPVSKALSYYFLAEGVWTILAGLLVWIWAETAIWSIYIHYILIAIVAGYLFYCYCVLYRAKKDGTEDAKIPEPSIRRYIERRRANRARKLAERQAKKEQRNSVQNNGRVKRIFTLFCGKEVLGDAGVFVVWRRGISRSHSDPQAGEGK